MTCYLQDRPRGPPPGPETIDAQGLISSSRVLLLFSEAIDAQELIFLLAGSRLQLPDCQMRGVEGEAPSSSDPCFAVRACSSYLRSGRFSRFPDFQHPPSDVHPSCSPP